jgi:hypothetical protein
MTEFTLSREEISTLKRAHRAAKKKREAMYVLTHAFRSHALKHSQWATAIMETIRLKFFKIGACVRELKTKVKVALPTSHPLKRILIRSFQLLENLAPA